MPNKVYAILAVSLAVLLISPVFADVFVPPGPRYNMSEWITPSLWVFNAKTMNPIGWTYTDGPTYYGPTQTYAKETPMCAPAEPNGIGNGATDIPYGTPVMVLGFVPGVTVAIDQSPPPVELQITWNGIPNTVTLTVPSSNVVGVNFPPTFYPDQTGPYQAAYPATPKQNATWNLWVGDVAYIDQKFFTAYPATDKYWETQFGSMTGEWFWYKFTPNVGDWIAYDSHGQTKFPPTYDITAMFEYGTSQIWFNHVAFDVSALEVHKDVSWCTDQTINDVVTIKNVGLVTINNLDLTQTFPSTDKLTLYPDPAEGAMAMVTDKTGAVVIPSQPLVGYIPGAENPNDLVLPAPFNNLPAGSTLTINVLIDVQNVGSTWHGSIVFDAMVSATQIPAWKDPIGLASISYPAADASAGATPATMVPLWTGWLLQPGSFTIVPEWYVAGPILRVQLYHPTPTMTFDPLPVPLIAGETSVTSADVALVRNAVVGLAPYDQRMDCNGNGRVDVQDLKAYELAVG